MKCVVCGTVVMTLTNGNYYCPTCNSYYEFKNCDMPFPHVVRYGWICPRCGKVNSPDECSCDCSCGEATITTGSTITIPDDIKISLSGIITGGSAPEAHFNKAVYADGGTVTTDCKINPEDFSTTTNTDSIVTLGLNKTKRNNK
jgi:hypothetical protein